MRSLSLSLTCLLLVAVPEVSAQGVSNWSTPVNISQLNTTGFEG